MTRVMAFLLGQPVGTAGVLYRRQTEELAKVISKTPLGQRILRSVPSWERPVVVGGALLVVAALCFKFQGHLNTVIKFIFALVVVFEVCMAITETLYFESAQRRLSEWLKEVEAADVGKIRVIGHFSLPEPSQTAMPETSKPTAPRRTRPQPRGPVGVVSVNPRPAVRPLPASKPISSDTTFVTFSGTWKLSELLAPTLIDVREPRRW